MTNATKSQLRKWGKFLHLAKSKYNNAEREETYFDRDENGDLRLYWKSTRQLVRHVPATV